MCATCSWESSKKAMSTRPEPPSRLQKMTRLPEGIGSVCVEARAPATSTFSGRPGAQVGGVGRAELAQQPVVVLHQVPAHVDGEGVEFGAELVAIGHLRQAARGCGHQLAAQWELPVGGGAVAGLPVQFGGRHVTHSRTRVAARRQLCGAESVEWLKR